MSNLFQNSRVRKGHGKSVLLPWVLLTRFVASSNHGAEAINGLKEQTNPQQHTSKSDQTKLNFDSKPIFHLHLDISPGYNLAGMQIYTYVIMQSMNIYIDICTLCFYFGCVLLYGRTYTI